MKYSISFFAPAYNEQDNIEQFIKDAVKALSQINNNYEIIIINDGSTDRTTNLIKKFSQKNRKIKQIIHGSNLGYGESIKTGIRASKMDLIFFTDSDCQFDLSEIEKFYKAIKFNNVVIGYRENRKDNLFRKFNGRIWTYMINFFYGLRVKDVNCAFKMFRKEVLAGIDLKSSGATINAELLFKLKDSGFIFFEMPVQHLARTTGQQTGAKISVIFEALSNLLILKK